MSIWRETRDDDSRRTDDMLADAGKAMSAEGAGSHDDPFFRAVVSGLASSSDTLPTGHRYPKRG
ncbi:hypothetical protein [Streptomyces sp. cg2]|uniref:hypothetical protein n=1 Tax=Streptomyces sp. cg2 TaxID=3238799 RepID=UPI0034E19733